MNDKLSDALNHQIEQEAKDYANLEICDWGKIQGNNQLYKWELAHDVYKDAAEVYAERLQAAEEKAEKVQHLIDATIEKIIDMIDFVAEAKGHVSDEEIISQVRKSLPELLEALTPKTGEDEG